MIEKSQDKIGTRFVLEAEDGPRIAGHFHSHRILREATEQEWYHLSAEEHVTLSEGEAVEIFEECHVPGEWLGRRVQAKGETKITGPVFYRPARYRSRVRRLLGCLAAQSRLDAFGTLLATAMALLLGFALLGSFILLYAESDHSGLAAMAVALVAVMGVLLLEYRNNCTHRGEPTNLHFPGEQCIGQVTEEEPPR